MSNIINRTVLVNQIRIPLIQFARNRGKINIQRPRQPHYERARVIAVTQPVYKDPPKDIGCFKKKITLDKTAIENPYNDIIAREVRNWLNNSSMVAVFHLNSITADDLFSIRVQLHKQNMHLKSYGKKIIAKAVSGTNYQAILPLFDSNHCIVFSTEQRVGTLLRLTRKVPQMILLGGIVDNTLLSRNELLSYGQLTSLQCAQADLVQVLNAPTGTFVQTIEKHQNNLVNVLDVYAKGNKET